MSQIQEKLIKIERILGDQGFCIKWEIQPHWVDVTAFEVVAQDGATGDDFYQRKDSHFSPDCVSHIDEAEAYLEGYVKWDGCTELDMGRPHWCGVEEYRRHCELLQYIYIRSQQLMDKADRVLFGGEWSPSAKEGKQ